MKAVNIIGVLVGMAGIVLTFMNTNLSYAEGPVRNGIANKHDNVGNVFSLLCVLFFVLTTICVYNWYLVVRRKN